MARLANPYSMGRYQEVLPQGGALTVWDPLTAAAGYATNPVQSFNAYGNRQVGNIATQLNPRFQNVYAGARQGLNIPIQPSKVSPLVSPGTRAFKLGRLGGRALPFLPVAANVLEGDLGGAAQSGIGGVIGGVLTGGNPLGIAAGTMLGEPVIGGITRLAGGAVGIDPSNPLSGPDWSLGPLALTPYARNKKQTEKAIKLAKLQLPLYDEIADKDLRRQQSLQSLADAGALIRGIYANNPY